ncbi:MAG: DUF262 domain-containing protein [Candidatus Cryptobacteroides sp.]
MKGEDKSLLKLMDGSENRFIIPVYQRNYDWGTSQCKQLFSDLIDIVKYKRPSHFFGCIVRARSKGGRADEFLIIDGQQRMTTVCLIFLAIYWNLEHKNIMAEDSKLAEKIFKKFLVDEYEVKEKKVRLKLNKEDRAAFDHLVDFGDGGSYTGSNVVTNFNYFYEGVKNLTIKIDDFFDAIRKLVVIDIFLGSDDDPQLIFESLNSTGLDLTEADKIRNYVLMGLEEDRQEEYYTKYWSFIERDCSGKNELDNFVRDYLTIKSPAGEIPNFKDIYPAFKAFTEGREIEPVLAEMKRYAALYKRIKSSQIGDSATNEIMSRLNYLELTITYAFLLGMLTYVEEQHLEEAEITKILSCIEVFVFRRLICGYPTNALNKIFATLHQQVLKNKKEDTSYYDVMVYLLENRKKTVVFPKDDEFMQSFVEKPIYLMRSKSRTYIFDRLENSDSKEKINIIDNVQKGELSVEHIMPQTLTDHWKSELGSDYSKIQEEWLHTIANLTLTGYNIQYSNRSFKEKKEDPNGFAVSPLRLNRYISKFDKWTVSEMKQRKEELGKMALSIWAYPETAFQPAVRPDDEVSIFDEEFVFTGRKITSFNLNGTIYPVNDWADTIKDVCKLLYEINPEILKKESISKENVWIISNPSGDSSCKQVSKDVWVLTCSDTNTKIRVLRQLARLYNLADDDLVFSLVPQKPKSDIFDA